MSLYPQGKLFSYVKAMKKRKPLPSNPGYPAIAAEISRLQTRHIDYREQSVDDVKRINRC
jgi:hypothetical protein